MSASFNRTDLGRGIGLTRIYDDKFKSVSAYIFFINKADEHNIVTSGFIPKLLITSNGRIRSRTELNKRLMKLYGSTVAVSSARAGDNHMFGLCANSLADKFTINNENVSGQLTDILLDCALYPDVTDGGFNEKYFGLTQQDVVDSIKSLINDKRSYAIIQARKKIYEGENINDLKPDEIARKGIFMSFQLPEEIPGISVTNFLKYAKNKITGKPVKIFEFKDELKKYMEELNMNPKNMDRSLNVGFSGGEKKKNEILQMLVLNPKLAILDETDSGLDVDAIKTVSKGIEMFKNENNAVLIITHNNKILHNLKVDYVHVLVDGKIVTTGSQELATEIENNGYSRYKK